MTNSRDICYYSAILLIVTLMVSPAFSQYKFARHTRLAKMSTSIPAGENPIDVLYYDVFLDVDPDARILQGAATLLINILDTTATTFYFNLVDLTVDSLFVDQQAIAPMIRNNQIIITTESLRSFHDSLQVTIYYHGHPGNDGFGGFFFTNRFIYTVGEGLDTNPPSMLRYWIPSNDVPSDKATFDLRITVPRPLQVISNGELVDEITGDTQTTFHWRGNYPIATYLVAVSIGEFSSFSNTFVSMSGDTTPLNFFAYSEHLDRAKEDWKDVDKMIAFFAKKFTPFPFEKYGMVEVPMRGAMEHQTMTSYSSALVTGDHRYDYVVVHELAHQWWGDLVTLSDWREIWLNEGFASYCEALYVEEQKGRQALQNYMDGFAAAYFAEAGRLGHFAIYDPKYLWGDTVYKKGAWILHMLRWTVGDSLFWQGMKNYAQTYAYANATINDFKNIFAAVSGKDLSWFFQQWLYEAGVPELEVAWETTRSIDDLYNVELTIRQKQTNEPLFYLPIEVSLQTASGSITDTIVVKNEEEKYFFSLQERPQDLIIDPNNWVLKKVDIISRPLPPGFTVNEFALAQNYPNPFTPDNYAAVTKITLQVGKRNAPMLLTLKIFNVLGREVKTLVQKKLIAGLYTFTWDGRDNQDRPVPSGIYLYKLEADDQIIMKKMSLVRH